MQSNMIIYLKYLNLFNMEFLFKYLKPLFLICGIFLICIDAFSIEKDAVINLPNLFDPYTNMENGIKGTVNAGGKIDVKIYEKTKNTLVYHTYITSSSTVYSGIETVYSRNDLGDGAIYYPKNWNSKDIKTALGSINRLYYDSIPSSEYPYHPFQNNIELKVKITEINAEMQTCKVPGLGIIDRNGGNALFHSSHFCYDLRNAADFVTLTWTKVKSPDVNRKSDLIIAAHRGVWGDHLGDGNPENSTAALAATKQYTPVLESDIMLTGNNELVVIHNYNLHRLTDYSGSDRDYLFNMKWSDLSGLHLRKRNMKVSNFKLLDFAALMDLIVKEKLVLTVDIKDIRSRYDLSGNCIDNCEYEDELAFIIGHEIAHAADYDCIKNSAASLATNAASSLTMKIVFDKTDNVWAALGSGFAVGLAGYFAENKYSRINEKDADIMAVDYLVQSGYNPLAGISILYKIGENFSDFFSTHPSTDKRIAAMYEYIKQTYPQYITQSFDTDAYTYAIEEMLFAYNNK